MIRSDFKWRGASALLGAGLLVAACGAGAQGPSSAATDVPGDATPPAASATGGTGSLAGKKIAFLSQGASNEWAIQLDAVAQEAVKRTGAELLYFDSQGSGDVQVQQMEDAQALGADVIVVTPMASGALVGPASRAEAAGIPVINCVNPIDGDDWTSFVGWDWNDRISSLRVLRVTDSQPVLGPNLVPNPSFEFGVSAGEVAGPAEWARSLSQDGKVYCDATWESAIAHTGTRSVSVTGPSSYPGKVISTVWQQTRPLPLNRSEKYRLSVWAKAEANFDPKGGQFWIFASAHDGSGHLVGKALGWTSFTPSLEWQQFGNEIQLPEGADSVAVEIGYMSNTPLDRNKTYFDDVSLSSIP